MAAVTFVEERKKQKKLIYIFWAVILITGLVLWQGVLKKPARKTEEVQAPAAEFGKAEINFKTLENPALRELQPFKKIEPFGEKIGRDNPFLPY